MSEVSGFDAVVESRAERTPSSRRLPQHTFSDLMIPISSALDLAEGREPGHARRIAYISMAMAEAMGLNSEQRLAACYAALMHDLGTVAAGAGLAAYVKGDERMVFASLPLLTPEEIATGASDSPEMVIGRIIEHVIHGARAAQELSLPPEAIRGIASHHERWDGTGYPHGLRGGEIPVTGRIVGLADQIEALIDQSSPLLARRNFSYWLSRLSGDEADPEVIEALRNLGAGDSFWLGMFSADLQTELSIQCGRLRESRSLRMLPFCEGLAELVDARFSFMSGTSAQVARLAEAMGKAMGFADQRVRLLRVAALLHDIGQLSMSERIMAKPGIFSIDEQEMLHLHPSYSSDIVRGIHGLEEVADWVASHHERVDGRGYPEARSGDEIPLESRILAVADSWVSITSDRPHRPAAKGAEAERRLQSDAGTQLDADIVELLLHQVVSKDTSAA